MVFGIVNVTKRRVETTCEDIIDLGGPLSANTRLSRRLATSYIPNPRLYPGPQSKLKAKKRAPVRPGEEERTGERTRRRKRAVRRAPVPNPRLYRAVPRVKPPAPPPARPYSSWPPPAQRQSLDTASLVALRVAEQRAACPWRRARPATSRSPVRSSQSSIALPVSLRARPRTPSAPSRGTTTAVSAERSRNPRLVVTLPADKASGRAPGSVPRYRPLSQHFRQLSLDTASSASPPPAARRPEPSTMAASSGTSLSPEEGSDGNDSSAPSEYLAEFLSAIMRRQYAEALKYCRLILQYEPNNATARGFFPLLQHKLGLRPKGGAENRVAVSHGLGSSESSTSGAGSAPGSGTSAGGAADAADVSDAESADAESYASLSMDSSTRSSRSPSPMAPHTHSSEESARSACSEGSEARWTSSGSPAVSSRSDADADDNGNTTTTTQASASAGTGTGTGAQLADLENDNAAGGDHTHLLKGASLQQLRAQFACSIK